MDFQDRLTILIPTYNRKGRLLETLRSISSQGYWGEYDIVIVDNCSNYNVEDAISAALPDAFCRMIEVQRWFFNTGMSTNISIAFEFARTKWCWFLSDDDTILDGALSQIFKDTKEHSSVAAIKYSIENICCYDDTTLSSIEEWAGYYINHNTGDKCYLSMLYNISTLYPYLSESTIHSYSYLSFWIPVWRAINETDSYMFMSSAQLYKYKPNNDGWSSTHNKYLNTLLGIRTLFDSRYGLTHKCSNRIKNVYADMFNWRVVGFKITMLEDNKDRSNYYVKLKNYLTGSLSERIIYSIFIWIVLFFNIPSNIIQNILRSIHPSRY